MSIKDRFFIVEQPNGNMAIFNRKIPELTFYNLTEKEVREYLTEHLSLSRSKVVSMITDAKVGINPESNKPYGRKEERWEKMMEVLKDFYGEEEVFNIEREIALDLENPLLYEEDEEGFE